MKAKILSPIQPINTPEEAKIAAQKVVAKAEEQTQEKRT